MTDSPAENADRPKQRNWIFMATALALTAAAALATYAWQGGYFTASAPVEADESAEEAARAVGIDANEKAAIEAIVRDYILANPEIIPEAVQILQERQAAARIDAIRNKIETPYAASYAGNPDGKVVLVEYSDFACGYCRQSVADVKRLIADNPDLKVVFHELPILSDESNVAAAWAMAAAKQGKYYPFHTAMFGLGRPNQSTIEQAAKTAGLDMAAARAFVASGEADGVIDDNISVAQRLQFNGTPSWVVGNQILSGAVGYDELNEAIAREREDRTG